MASMRVLHGVLALFPGQLSYSDSTWTSVDFIFHIGFGSSSVLGLTHQSLWLSSVLHHLPNRLFDGACT